MPQHTTHLLNHKQIMVTILRVGMKIISDCYFHYIQILSDNYKYDGPKLTAYNDHYIKLQGPGISKTNLFHIIPEASSLHIYTYIQTCMSS